MRGDRTAQSAFLQTKLNELFQLIRPNEAREYSPEEVQDATGIDASYIRKMRQGRVANPGRSVLEALSQFFGIDPGYWFRSNSSDSLQREADQHHLTLLHRQLEEADLSPDQAEFVGYMMAKVIEMAKRLPAPNASPADDAP